MINNQLLDYVQQQLALKVSREAISTNLKGAGWSDADISEAFAALSPMVPSHTPTPVAPVVSPVTPVISPTLPSSYSSLIQPRSDFSALNQVNHAVLSAERAGSSEPSHRGRKIFLAVLILVLLGVAGAGAYAYYSGVFVTLPGLIPKAIDGARATTSASYDTTISIDLSQIKSLNNGMSSILSPNLASSKIVVTGKGAYDVSDKNNLKTSSIVSVDVGALSLRLEFRMLNNTLYGTVTKIPTQIALFLPTASAYENKWFSLPLNQNANQALTQVTPNPVNPVGSFSSLNTSITDKLTTDQKEHIYQMTRDAHFIETVKRLAPETVTGEPSYHFSFDLDRNGIATYLQSLKEYVNSIGKDDSSLSAFDPTSFNKQLDNVKDFSGEVWIGRNDKLLHKLVIDFGLQPDSTKDEQVKISVVSIMSGWNQPVSITAPADSTPFSDLLSSVMSQMQNQGKESAVKSNLLNMRAGAEIFYSAHHNSYSGFCSSVEGKSDRRAVEAAGGTNFACHTTSSSFAAGAKLIQDSSGYWCVDSTGVSMSMTAPLANAACPVK